MQIELQVGLWVFQWQLLQYMRAPIYASPGDIWFIKVILQKRLDANRDTLVGVEPLYSNLIQLRHLIVSSFYQPPAQILFTPSSTSVTHQIRMSAPASQRERFQSH